MKFAIVWKPGRSWIRGKTVLEQPGLEQHGEYLARLHKDNKMVFSGPFTDIDGGGITIIEASSEREARDIARGDPTVVNGLMDVEVHPFEVGFNVYADHES